MSIAIKGEPGQRLRVTGDIATTLRAPFDEVEERFLLAASDGTLIEGRLHGEEDQCNFRIVVDGAGIARVGRGELALDGRVEWVTISRYSEGALVERGVEPLPLFELID